MRSAALCLSFASLRSAARRQAEAAAIASHQGGEFRHFHVLLANGIWLLISKDATLKVWRLSFLSDVASSVQMLLELQPISAREFRHFHVCAGEQQLAVEQQLQQSHHHLIFDVSSFVIVFLRSA